MGTDDLSWQKLEIIDPDEQNQKLQATLDLVEDLFTPEEFYEKSGSTKKISKAFLDNRVKAEQILKLYFPKQIAYYKYPEKAIPVIYLRDCLHRNEKIVKYACDKYCTDINICPAYFKKFEYKNNDY